LEKQTLDAPETTLEAPENMLEAPVSQITLEASQTTLDAPQTTLEERIQKLLKESEARHEKEINYLIAAIAAQQKINKKHRININKKHRININNFKVNQNQINYRHNLKLQEHAAQLKFFSKSFTGPFVRNLVGEILLYAIRVQPQEARESTYFTRNYAVNSFKHTQIEKLKSILNWGPGFKTRANECIDARNKTVHAVHLEELRRRVERVTEVFEKVPSIKAELGITFYISDVILKFNKISELF
jgi:hypothetical protein